MIYSVVPRELEDQLFERLSTAARATAARDAPLPTRRCVSSASFAIVAAVAPAAISPRCSAKDR
jgi:hypothetical protein